MIGPWLRSILTPADPFAVVTEALDRLERNAKSRVDTRALAKINEARVIITTECLKGAVHGGRS